MPDPSSGRYAALCQQARLHPDPAHTQIAIHKARRCLQLWQDGLLLVELPVIVGRAPTGTKEREGDLRTPEGDYLICYRNPESRFHRFLGLNYPNAEDAARGRAQGLLTDAQYATILAAAASGAQPDWYTPMGGEVGIHGGGIDREGTRGCIALADPDIELLWDATMIGTPVSIHPD